MPSASKEGRKQRRETMKIYVHILRSREGKKKVIGKEKKRRGEEEEEEKKPRKKKRRKRNRK